MHRDPLRYNISSWYQLPQCLSNNSKELKITVSEFVNNRSLQGLRISVQHIVFGDLFVYVLDPSGDVITTYTDLDSVHQLTTSQILKELERFGFLITFNKRPNLSGDQLEYLITLQKLKFDKIRILPVSLKRDGSDVVESQLVAFKSSYHELWLNNLYMCKLKEYQDALVAGTAVNLSKICESRKYSWDWLDYVANISDILLDNVEDKPCR